MSKKWIVKFLDDELEGEQYAHFSSQPEALTWIKFVQNQECYDPSGFEVLDGPYEELSEASKQVDENKVLTEGKHWPEDYIKTAYNLIKQSTLGQQFWYTDSLIKQDVQTFADEFAPLSHKSSNLGFFMAIVRWFIEYSGDSKQKYQEFIERKLDFIIAALLKIRADRSYDAKADEIKKMSFSQFEKLIDEVKSKTSTDNIDVSQVDAKYDVVPKRRHASPRCLHW